MDGKRMEEGQKTETNLDQSIAQKMRERGLEDCIDDYGKRVNLFYLFKFNLIQFNCYSVLI